MRLIFMSYLSGMGKKAIADLLNEMNAPKRFGYDTWRISTVDYILSNERYIGDALFQKYYTTEMLPFILRRNQGQKAKYYVEGTNPPIISKEVFEAAQGLLNSTQSTYHGSRNPQIFSGMMRCSCGATYAPHQGQRKNVLGMQNSRLRLSYCVVKIFFQNIKRGGILLVQMSVGSLYMFSVLHCLD